MIMYYAVMDGKEGTTPRSDFWQLSARSDAVPMSSRSGRGRQEPDRASVECNDMVQDLGQPAPMMVDSYLQRLDSVARSDEESWETTQVQSFREPDTAREGPESVRTPKQKWPSYHAPANGLRIITWDEFVETPDMLNGYFVLEKSGYISHDPSKVNVFFHDARMMHSNIGSLSPSGKAWTVYVEEYQELKTVRRWLTERISVLVVTLLNRNQQRLGESACCLLAVDPSFVSIKDKINEAMETAMESFVRQRQFCLFLDFNSTVKQWCRNALHMECEAQGAKIVITNGDEPPDFSDSGGNVCCRYMCMPFRYLQGKAYQVKRRSTYDDTEVVFDEEQIMLCTANKKLQSYAEKALSAVPTPSGRRVKKKNTVTFTTSTQTATDTKDNTQNNGDCGVIDLEDTERGGEDETVMSCRDPIAQDRVFKDKDRACITSSDPDSEIARPKTSDKPTDSISDKIVNYKLSNRRNRTEKRTISTSLSEEPKPEVQRETTDTIGEGSILESASASQDPKMDIKADVHCDSILEHPAVEDEVKINYTRSKFSNLKEIETVIEPPEEEAVRTSVQTLKLGNFTSELPPRNHAQFSIDVFDQHFKETVKAEQPKPETVISVAKQQKRIDKMLKDIMGPVSDRVKKPPRKSKPKNGVINKGFQDDLKDTKPPSGDQVRPLTSDVCPFARRDGYSTLPLTKVNGGRSTSKSAEFEPNNGGDFTTLVQPISAKRATKIRKKFMEKEEEKLFTPRILLEKDRNCFSDLEPVEDFTDVEGHAASDREGVVSPRVISVKKTDKTVSMDSVRTHTDTELELTDCDTEDMSVSESDTKAHARKTRSNKRSDRGQKGQYDSRRKYLALNSLRRKTKAKALNAEIRNRIRLAQS